MLKKPLSDSSILAAGSNGRRAVDGCIVSGKAGPEILAALARRGAEGVLEMQVAGAPCYVPLFVDGDGLRQETGVGWGEGIVGQASDFRFVPIAAMVGRTVCSMDEASLGALTKRAEAAVIRPLRAVAAIDRMLRAAGVSAPLALACADLPAQDAGYWMQAAALRSLAALRTAERAMAASRSAAPDALPRELSFEGPSVALATEPLDPMTPTEIQAHLRQREMMRCVVTGAASGIGRCLVELLAGGTDVVQTGKDITARSDLVVASPHVTALDLDLTDVAQHLALARTVAGQSVVLINNAGYLHERGFRTYPEVEAQILPHTASDLENTVRHLRQALAVNALAPVALQGAVSRQTAHLEVVNVSSIFADFGVMASVGTKAPTYCLSKAVLDALCLWVGRQDGAVRPAVVHPGWCNTRTGGPEAPLTPAQGAATVATAMMLGPKADAMWIPREN